MHALDFTIQPSSGLDRLAEADLIALPAVSEERLRPGAALRFSEDLLDALRRAVERGGRLLSVCSGAFILGEAGLLDGRRCTTHWRHAAELARRYPEAKVDPDVLYVDDDPVMTSAGTAAGIDACLYLVRKEQGSRVANGIARRMVVPPHRDGGQAQYVVQPVAPSCDGSLRDLLKWLSSHLDQALTVRQLAARASMSERTCPAFRTGHRDHPAALADRPAHPARPAAPRGDRRDRRCHCGTGRLRQRDRPAAPFPRLAWHHPERLPSPVPRRPPQLAQLDPAVRRSCPSRHPAAAPFACSMCQRRGRQWREAEPPGAGRVRDRKYGQRDRPAMSSKRVSGVWTVRRVVGAGGGVPGWPGHPGTGW